MKPYYDADGVTIYHADALTVLPTLDAIDAVITDPPYSSGGQFRGDRANASTLQKYVQSNTLTYRPEFAGDNRDQRSYLVWSTLWMLAARRASRAGAVLCTFSDWRQLPTTTDAIQCAGWTWRNLATWHKPGIRMQRGAFSLSAEYLAYATNGPTTNDFDGAVQNVFACLPVDDKIHIAEKPLAVMRWILSVVPPASLVLDPFMGIGSTLRAAKDAGHRAIGIDTDERYCDLAATRLRQNQLPFTPVPVPPPAAPTLRGLFDDDAMP